MEFNSRCAGCYAGLSCSVRIEILNLLKKKGETSVLEIAKYFKVTQPTISHHLQYLKDAGIVKSRRESRKIYYSINPKCGSKCGLFI